LLANATEAPDFCGGLQIRDSLLSVNLLHDSRMIAMQYDGPSIPISDSPRILITRLSAVGDCIHTLPVVHALRERFPEAFIAWATQTGPASLLNGVEAIDEIIEVPRNWMKSLAMIRRIRAKLRSLKIDVAVDPQSLTKSSVLGWLSGARHRIGFDRPQGRELSLWLNQLLINPAHEHVVDRYLNLLAPLGIIEPKVSFTMPDPHEENVARFLASSNLRNQQFAIVNPGAGWPSKIWPAERYGAVAAHLGQNHSLRSVVTWAGDDELAMAKAVCQSAHGQAVLAESTSLTELRSLIRQAQLFVGSDTGPMHLAVAVGTPCVSIYGPTSPLRCGPYGSEHFALHIPVETNQKLRSDDNTAMSKITTESVVDACEQSLGRINRHAA
jgi:lipopolysaccharide heptosyltransferase I